MLFLSPLTALLASFSFFKNISLRFTAKFTYFAVKNERKILYIKEGEVGGGGKPSPQKKRMKRKIRDEN